MRSPYGQEFRHYLNLWDRQTLLEEIEDKKNRIKSIIEGGPYILFLRSKGGDDILGADETARVAYARMLDDDEDEADTDNFMATNMCKMVNGDQDSTTIVNKKDLKKYKVLDDHDELIDRLLKVIKSDSDGPKTMTIVKMKPSDMTQDLSEFD
jgi:hypothetical protein